MYLCKQAAVCNLRVLRCAGGRRDARRGQRFEYGRAGRAAPCTERGGTGPAPSSARRRQARPLAFSVRLLPRRFLLRAIQRDLCGAAGAAARNSARRPQQWPGEDAARVAGPDAGIRSETRRPARRVRVEAHSPPDHVRSEERRHSPSTQCLRVEIWWEVTHCSTSPSKQHHPLSIHEILDYREKSLAVVCSGTELAGLARFCQSTRLAHQCDYLFGTV